MFNRKNKKINNSEPLKRWFWSLTVILTFCLFSYGYCVRGAIVNIVARQNMEAQLSDLNTKVSNLETEYIRSKSAITPELAVNLGFRPLSNTKFVTRQANTPNLSLLINN